MDIKIDARSAVTRLSRDLDDFARKQVPYATALAINDIGAQVLKAEVDRIKEVFPTATPFTLKSVRLAKANKYNLTARVFVQDIAARYLAPYDGGGVHFLNSRALLNPKDIRTNQYGNLPRNALATLKGRADVFVGPVTTKSGVINGVWQRVPVAKTAPKVRTVRYGKRGSAPVKAAAASSTTLKLLIRFGDALPVKEHLDWGDTAQEIFDAGFNRAFAIGFAKALQSARP